MRDYRDLLKNITNNKEESTEPTLTKHSRVLLIDGLNLFLRNFAVLNFINDKGVHVGGLGGFLRSLGSLINQIKPTSVYIVFDGIGSSENRKNLIPEYKSNRNIGRINWDAFNNLEEENTSKVDQIGRLIHYLRCLPVKIVSIDRVEADDILAYLSNHLADTYDSRVFLVSSDKDFLQLVTDKITVYRPTEKEFYTPKTIIQKFGILPENYLTYKTLLKDKSDVLEGIKGLGDKGPLKKFPELAKTTVTLEDIFEISEQKYKEHVIYARIILARKYLEDKFKIINLQNPLIDDAEKQQLVELTEEETPTLSIPNFVHFYNEDGLQNTIKTVDWWLRENFNNLNKFK